jgi:hypothetical protein
MVSIMAWAGLEDKLIEEVVKSRDLGGSLLTEHDEHEPLRIAIGLACDDLSLTPEQEGSSLAVHVTCLTTGCMRSQGLRLALASTICL